MDYFGKEEKTNELLFNLEDFHIFGNDGVIESSMKGNTHNVCYNAKNRTNLEIGDCIGILTNYMLSIFQIKSIGYIVGNKGTRANPIYDIWIVENDPNEIIYEGFSFVLKERKIPLRLGLISNVSNLEIVRMKNRLNCFDNFKFTCIKTQEYPSLNSVNDKEITDLILKLKEEIKQEKKRKRNRNNDKKMSITKEMKKL